MNRNQALTNSLIINKMTKIN